MGTFTDDFQRADGALGANWWTTNANLTIASGKLTATSINYARPANEAQAGPADATITIASAPSNRSYVAVVVKANDNMSQGYRFHAGVSGGNIVGYLGTVGGTEGDIAQAYRVSAFTYPATLRLTYSAGYLQGEVNGLVVVQGYHSQYDANSRVGLYNYTNVSVIDAFTTTSPDAASFSVTPTAVLANGPAVLLTMNGYGTAWTPGTPGSPTFTVGAGSLSAQSVSSPGLATALFTPPATEQSVTVTDPSSGLTYPIWCGFNVPSGGGTGFGPKLTDVGAGIVNAAGANYPTSEVVTLATAMPTNPLFPDSTSIWDFLIAWAKAQHGTEEVTAPDQGVLTLLWDLLNDRNSPGVGPWPAPSGPPVAQHLDLLSSDIGNLTAERSVFLPDVVTSIKGEDGPNLLQLETELGVADQEDYQSVIDAINLTRGRQTVDLAAIYDLLLAYRTDQYYTVQDILDAIGTGGGGGSIDLEPVLHKLQHIQPDEYVSLTTLHSQQAVMLAAIVALAAAFAKFITPAEFTVTSILDTITNGNAAIIDEIRKIKAPPHWPGHANVSFGTPHDLATTVQVDGPMHGVLIDITATEPGTSYMQYDGVKSWRHIGGLAFYTDDGQMETYQALNFASAVYVPKTMSVAQGVKLYKSHLPRGSITPWTIAE